MNSRQSNPGAALRPATQEQITALAHELWRERGCPEGSDVDIWLEAERQLNAGLVTAKNKRSGAVRDHIPADPARVDPDDDPAVTPRIDRQLRGMGGTEQRSPTSFGV